MSERIELLNIPNSYSSYYILGMDRNHKVIFKPENQFKIFNNRGFIIFRYKGKLGVIDNHDPVGVQKELYQSCDFYFATNKLLHHPEYDQPKVKPLFPHYPVNSLGVNLRLFGLSWLSRLTPKDFAREVYILVKRPKFEIMHPKFAFKNFIFFSGSTWKKEPWANQIRAEFIRACKKHPGIKFEGGFIPRLDGNNFGFDQELNTKTYPPKLFSRLSADSLVNLNNPAVLGAVSWRLAEYWNSGTFVLSFPFAIDLPVLPVHGEHIHFIQSSDEYESVLDLVVQNPSYHKKIAKGGHSFFLEHCTPSRQWEYISSFFG